MTIKELKILKLKNRIDRLEKAPGNARLAAKAKRKLRQIEG